MKKFINDVALVEDQMIQGMVKAYPGYLRKLDCGNVVVRANKKEGKVALISGGGSGHEPAHGGYVGCGMLDAAVAGAVFTSPTPDQIYEGIKAIATDAGVLMVVKNYTGDVMNFEMAAEMAEMEGITVKYVVTNDDVAVKDSLYTVGRRGVAGTVFVHKIAGAMAETGASLDEVHAVAQKVIDNVRTMGAAIAPCTVPAAGKPGFELSDDEMEVGIGIHGEPGTHRESMKTADQVADMLLAQILGDIDYEGREVAVMINGAGSTPLMELFIINNRVSDVLAEKGIRVYKTFVGEYMTSIEMQGFSIYRTPQPMHGLSRKPRLRHGASDIQCPTVYRSSMSLVTTLLGDASTTYPKIITSPAASHHSNACRVSSCIPRPTAGCQVTFLLLLVSTIVAVCFHR